MRKREQEWREELRDNNVSLEKSNRALRGVATRRKNQLNKVKKGVCPCCDRFFENVYKHMKTKHPEHVQGEA